MKLFRRQKDPSIPPELQPYYNNEQTPAGEPRWWVRPLVALIILVALGLIAWGVYTAVSGGGNSGAGHTKAPGVHWPTEPAPKPGQPKAPVQPKPGANGQTGQGKPASPPSQAGGKGSNLSNTGPGSTLAIFLGTAAVGTLLHRAYLRRRLARG